MTPESLIAIEEARDAAERVARDSYGRLLAFLAAQWRDVAAAEDALADAFAAALASWPRTGAPERPEAWLMAAARRKLIDAARRAGVRAGAQTELAIVAEQEEEQSSAAVPDKRLELMFVCAHPAIDASIRTPLMLQTVLGLSSERIASAFLVKPAAMAQRLVRAKTKIRAAGVPFETPEPEDLPGRLDDVLRAIYAAFGAGWDGADGLEADGRDLAEEAIWLARLTAALAPQSAEALGLLSLMLHCEARRPARRDACGRYVPLTDQEPGLWRRDMIEEAEAALARAANLGPIGRFQLEAAIQSAHARRAWAGTPDWPAIARLYDGLVALEPAIGALVARADAHGEAHGAEAGLAALADVPAARVASYQPFWAVRAHLLAEAGQNEASREAYERAMGLSENEAVRAWLAERAVAL